MKQSWFLDNVIKNPAAAGAVRSLLGKNFGLPLKVSSHRAICPGPAQEWHIDGGSKFGPALDYLQVFYYPQDCPRDMGPTEALAGSHHFYTTQIHMGQYGRISGSKHLVAPAGSIFLTVYRIWHRRSDSTGTGIRNNLKYNYWRTVSPERDWIIEPDFDIAAANYSLRPNYPTYAGDDPDARVRWGSAEMFCWLWGKSDQFYVKGGQGWPTDYPGYDNYNPYGVPRGLVTQ